MKAVIISEPSFESFRDQLISQLVKAMVEREARVASGDMTGLSPTPENTIQYHVHTSFELLRNS